MVRQWLYEDQLNPVVELDGSGNVLWHYVYASREHSPDFLVSDTGAVYRVISDQLGSPRLIVNIADSADVLLEAEYTAFGVRTVVSGDAGGVSVGFAGGVFDVDTGLTRFGARDYDPVVGRWVSKDPIRFEAGQANVFAYVGQRSSQPHGPHRLAEHDLAHMVPSRCRCGGRGGRWIGCWSTGGTSRRVRGSIALPQG
jgi:RHS repeat-associated protein